MQKAHVVALHVAHRATHAREALAKAEVIRGIVFRRLALRPIPIAAILQIHDVETVLLHRFPPGLQAQIIHTTETLLEYLRRHDGRADRKHDTAIESLDASAEETEVEGRGTAQRGAVEHGVIRNNVIAD